MSAENQPPQQTAGRCGSHAAVLVLLVCVAAILAGLWIRERSRRNDAEQCRAAAERRYVEPNQFSPDRLRQMAGALFATGAPVPSGAEPIHRPDVPKRSVELQGRTRTMLQISAEAGRRMGFLPGDVVVVDDEPAASQP